MAFGAVFVGAATDVTNDAPFDYTLSVGIGANEGIVVTVEQGTTRDVATGGVTDDAGNTYTRRVGVAGDTAGCEIWDCLSNTALSAGQKISVTMTSTERTKALSVYTLGGPATYVDGALANGATSSPSVSLTLAASCALIGVLSCVGSSTITNDPDFTSDVNQLGNGSARQQTVHGSGSGTVTYNPGLSASTTWRIGLVAYADAGGGGTTETITVSQGALTLAGQAVTETETIGVSAGSLSVAGQTVSVTDAEAIPVTAGALSIAGQAVSETETIAVQAGALAISGQTANVLDSEMVPVTAGALAIAGQPVTETETIAVAAGSLTLVGGTVSVSDGSATETIPVGAGSLILTGGAVAVTDVSDNPQPAPQQPDGDILGRPRSSGVRPSQKGNDTRTALQRLADGYRASAIERVLDRFRVAQTAVEQDRATPAHKAVREAVTEARKALPAVQEMAPAFDWQALLDEMEQATRAQAGREQQLALMRQAIAQAEQVQREIEDEEEAIMLLMAG
jgi:hypothetical protein